MTRARPDHEAARQATGDVVLSLDAMGSDNGPAAVVAGLYQFLKEQPDAKVLLHGPQETLHPLAQPLGERVRLVHADGVVAMTDKPSQVMRRGRDTSMWSAIDALREGEAQAAVSCGNTGALMAVAMLRLRRAEGVNRPAIACLWPSRNPSGFNVMLDVGADIRADAEDLLAYAFMGAAYARQGLGTPRPRVGLLNVGTEEHKGRPELREAHELLSEAAGKGDFTYVGFVEGGDIPSEMVDVVVTDGFTGNVALKTGEGTARLISGLLREALTAGPLGMAAALLARAQLGRLQRRIDPRRVNGGVFLGLNGTVIKSHGSADATGVAAALRLAYRLAAAGFAQGIAAQVASAAALAQDAAKLRDGIAPDAPADVAEAGRA
ncbi:phosphate acyltransferase PlsX [Rubellimicrobium sp. CFH 75288]|uniref:phosphate acyltransferase PlsX n=1 Tax=Rubellimicrobium sp. CFH 75288 TaxID=2697034 RepID=UPI001411B35D|nr:phosphate acyltransferase PlsX [Rubellimicrobium sp. CFH 75288]NAZ37043.1 phosphate acyltransferase PlsX [Rubellimicrobium sp. CFH 75288]